jgi:hypothetical protein
MRLAMPVYINSLARVGCGKTFAGSAADSATPAAIDEGIGPQDGSTKRMTGAHRMGGAHRMDGADGADGADRQGGR